MTNSPRKTVKNKNRGHNNYADSYTRGRNATKTITKVVTMTGDEWDELKYTNPEIRQVSFKNYIQQELCFSWLIHVLSFQRLLALCAFVTLRMGMEFATGQRKDGSMDRSIETTIDADHFDRIVAVQDDIITDQLEREERHQNRRKGYKQNNYSFNNQ